MAKKKQEDTKTGNGRVKYTLRFTTDVIDKNGNIEHKKGSIITGGEGVYQAYRDKVEIVSTENVK